MGMVAVLFPRGIRRRSDLPREKVRSSWLPTIVQKCTRHNVGRMRARLDLAAADILAQQVDCGRSRAIGCVYAFSTGAVAAFRQATAAGRLKILEQSSPPVQTVLETMEAECEKWKELVEFDRKAFLEGLATYRVAESLELETADLVIAPSNFVAAELEKIGVKAPRVTVLPYGLARSCESCTRGSPAGDDTLKILFVGNVSIGKGVPYLVEAARMLPRRGFEIRVVGSAQMSLSKLKIGDLPIQFLGRVPRGAVEDHYRWADVLCLPTLYDGFGLVQLEAFAHGVPVVTTTAAGGIVKHGVNGIVVSPRDALGLSRAFQELREDPAGLEAMRVAALSSMERYSVDNYKRGLQLCLKRLSGEA